MSTVNNTSGIPDPNLSITNTPIDTQTSSSATTDPYYASNISPASAKTSSAPSNAANAGTPMLDTPPQNRISISDYSKVMSDVVRKFTESAYNDIKTDITISSAYYRNTSQGIISLQQLLDWSNNIEIENAALKAEYEKQLKLINDQIAQFNQDILASSPLPDSDQAAIDEMNDAIKKFNDAQAAYVKAQQDFAKGAITSEQMDAATATFNGAQTEYAAAVAKYNAYGTARNASLTPIVNDYNKNVVGQFDAQMADLYKMIDQYNAMAAPAGLKPIPYPQKPASINLQTYLWQPMTATPTTYPITSVANRPAPVSPVSSVPLTNLDAQNATIQANVGTAFDETFAILKAFMDAQTAKEASVEYYKNKHKINKKTSNPLIDETTVTIPSRDILRSQGSEGTPSSIELINRFGQIVFPELAAQAKVVNSGKSPKKPDSLFAMSLIRNFISAGLFGAKDAISRLGNDLGHIDPNGNSAKITLAFGFAKELQTLGSGETYQENVDALSKAAVPTSEAADVNKSVDGMRLSSALMSLFQISRALDAPELVRDMIIAAGGSEMPELKGLIENSGKETLARTLTDPVSKNELAKVMTAVLVDEGGKSNEEASSIVHHVIEGCISKNRDDSTEGLLKSFQQELENQQISSSESTKLASIAVTTLTSELEHPELNYLLNPGVVKQAILQHPIFTDPIVAKAVNEALKLTKTVSQRQFRENIVQHLRAQGIAMGEGYTKANEVLEAIDQTVQNGSKPPVSFQKNRESGVLTEELVDQLKNNLGQKIIQLLKPELGIVPSHEISRDLVDLLISDKPNSILNTLRQSIKINNEHAEKDQFTELNRQYLDPTVELYAFAKTLLDPGNSILYSAATGLMYARNEPSNFKKGIDVPI